MFADYADHLSFLDDDGTSFLFLTGNAGTGKSTLIGHHVETTANRVVLLAPTGIAALRIGGSTIHRFFGFPTDRPYYTPKTWQRLDEKVFRSFDEIIIDEVSMVRSDMMQAIYLSLTNSDKYGRPWGGKLVRVVGDLCQLPPVVVDKEHDTTGYLNKTYGGIFFFCPPGLGQIPRIELKKVHRQRDDRFVNMLNFMRAPCKRQDHLEYLINEVNKHVRRADESVIRLCATNKTAEAINVQQMQKLKEKEFVFEATIFGNIGRDLPTEQTLRLKLGCQVMFCANNAQWKNGEIGKVIGFEMDEGLMLPIVQKNTGQVVTVERHQWKKTKYEPGEDDELEPTTEASFTQIPLKLAYGITIHKSQGLTLDQAHIDFGRGAFAHGQAYVAFSRLSSLAGLSIQSPVQASDFIFDEAIYSPRFEDLL